MSLSPLLPPSLSVFFSLSSLRFPPEPLPPLFPSPSEHWQRAHTAELTSSVTSRYNILHAQAI